DVAFLTTAGQAWNDWGGGLAANTYPAVLLETQKYLTSGGGDSNRLVGSLLPIEVTSTRYESRMRCFYQPETKDNNPGNAAGNQGPDAKDTGLTDKGEVLGSEAQGRLRFDFDGAKKPGLYRFELTLRDDKGTA